MNENNQLNWIFPYKKNNDNQESHYSQERNNKKETRYSNV